MFFSTPVLPASSLTRSFASLLTRTSAFQLTLLLTSLFTRFSASLLTYLPALLLTHFSPYPLIRLLTSSSRLRTHRRGRIGLIGRIPLSCDPILGLIASTRLRLTSCSIGSPIPHNSLPRRDYSDTILPWSRRNYIPAPPRGKETNSRPNPHTIMALLSRRHHPKTTHFQATFLGVLKFSNEIFLRHPQRGQLADEKGLRTWELFLHTLDCICHKQYRPTHTSAHQSIT